MSGSNARDIELRIRARDQTRGTLQSVITATSELTARLNEQAQAAARGEVSVKELETTLAALVRTDKQLASQSGAVARFQELTTQLAGQREAANRSRDALQQLEASLNGVSAAKRRQNAEFAAASTAAGSDARAVAQTEKALLRTGAALEKAGIDTKALTAAEEQLGAAAQRTGEARQRAAQAIDNLPAQLRAIQATSGALRELEAEENRAREAHARRIAGENALQARPDTLAADRRQARQRELVETFTPVLDLEDAKRKLDTDLAKFRALAEEKARSSSTLRVPSASITTDSSVAAAVERIVAPAQAARRTLEGVESEVARLSAAAAQGGQPIQSYAEALRGLESVQRALVQQGGIVDAFRGQLAVVKASSAEFKQAQATAKQLAEQVRGASTVDQELANRLEQARSTMTRLGEASGAQAAKLRELAQAAKAAGLDVRVLADGETRLLAAAQKVTPEIDRLRKVVQAGVSPGGAPALFGLRPYQLTNLSFQVNDVVTQLASGTSVMQTLAQQGGQIIQIFPNAISNILKFVPAIAAIGGAAVVAFGAVKHLLDQQASLREFQGLLTASTNGAGNTAPALVAAQKTVRDFGASFDEAGQAIRAFLDRDIRPDKIIAFGKASQDLVDLHGGKLPEAARTLAQAFTSDIEAITKLNEKYDFLTQGIYATIKALFEEGKAEEARGLAFDTFAAKLSAGAAQARGPWTDAAREFSKQWNAMLDSLAKTDTVTGVIDLLTRAIIRLTAAFAGLNKEQQVAAATAKIADLQGRLAEISRAPVSGSIGSAFGRSGAGAQAEARRNEIAAANTEIEAQFALIRKLNEGTQQNTTATTANTGALTANNKEIAIGRRDRDSYNDAIQRQIIAGDQVLSQQQREILQSKSVRDLTTAEIAARVQLIQLEKQRSALAAGASASDARLAGEIAAATELAKIQKERAQQGASEFNSARSREEALANALVAIETKVTANQKAELDQRLIQYDEALKKLLLLVEDAKRKGSKSVLDVPFPEFVAKAQTATDKAKINETLKFDEQQLNDLIRTRNELVAANNALVAAGAITQTEASERNAKIYADASAGISAASDELINFAAKARETSQITQTAFDLIAGKVALARAQIGYMDPALKELNKSIQDAFVSNALSAFEEFGKAIGEAVAGTKTWGQAFQALGASTAKFFAGLLKDIAAAILKMQALKLLESIFPGGGIGSLLGLGGSAAASGAGAGLGSGVIFLHGGGVVGDPTGVYRNVPRSIFTGAPRFHSGGLPGLRPDEIPLIAQRGEEVLSKSDPRNVLNRGIGGGGGGPQQISIRNVLVTDPNLVTDSIQTPAGERAIMSIIRANASTVRSMVRA